MLRHCERSWKVWKYFWLQRRPGSFFLSQMFGSRYSELSESRGPVVSCRQYSLALACCAVLPLTAAQSPYCWRQEECALASFGFGWLENSLLDTGVSAALSLVEKAALSDIFERWWSGRSVRGLSSLSVQPLTPRQLCLVTKAAVFWTALEQRLRSADFTTGEVCADVSKKWLRWKHVHQKYIGSQSHLCILPSVTVQLLTVIFFPFLFLHRYCFIVTLGYLILCQITRVYVFDYGMYSADFTG